MSGLLPISAFLSPPEPKQMDSFDTPSKSRPFEPITPDHKSYVDAGLMHPQKQSQPSKNAAVPPSPPTSPWTVSQNKISTYQEQKSGEVIRDPVLYESSESPAAHQPLFPSAPEPAVDERSEAVNAIVKDHIKKRDRDITDPPSREDYVTCIDFVSRLYNANPGRYLKRAREEIEEHYYRSIRIGAKPRKEAPYYPPQTKEGPTERPFKKQKTNGPLKALPAKVSPAKVQIPRANRSPKVKAERVHAVRAMSIKRPTNLDYASIPNYCPPISTLPQNFKVFKVEDPSPNPLDLSNDKDRAELHESEIVLAASLRLSCALYLCCKRRLFVSRVEALRIGKTFRKTDAQKACQIDVNKASKLWAAYEKVGWLERRHFDQYV